MATDIRNMDLGAMIKWNEDVQKEFDEVHRVLDEVAKVLSDCNDDDTIYGCFKKIGDKMAEAYLGLDKAFKEVSEATGGIIDSLKQGMSKIGEGIGNFVENFHL